MTDIVVTLIVAVVGSTGLWSLIQTAISNRRNRNSVERKALQAILRDRLLQGYRYHKGRGYCPIQDKDSWEAMFQAYHNLGQNGVLNSIHEEILDMPTEPEKGKTK